TIPTDTLFGKSLALQGFSRPIKPRPQKRIKRTHRLSSSILVGLLWCMALVAVIVVGVLHTARLHLMIGKNYTDKIQARYLALAGVEKAKALLYEDAILRRGAAKNHTGQLYDTPEDFREVTLGPGKFSVVRPGRMEEGGGMIFGVADE